MHLTEFDGKPGLLVDNYLTEGCCGIHTSTWYNAVLFEKLSRDGVSWMICSYPDPDDEADMGKCCLLLISPWQLQACEFIVDEGPIRTETVLTFFLLLESTNESTTGREDATPTSERMRCYRHIEMGADHMGKVDAVLQSEKGQKILIT